MSEPDVERSTTSEMTDPRTSTFACVRSDDGVEAVTLRLRGRVEGEAADRLREALLTALGDARLVVLDLHELEAIDSSGVHAIVHADRAAEADHRRLVLVRAPPQVDAIFRFEGRDGVLTIIDNAAAAKALIDTAAGEEVLPGAMAVDVRRVAGAWGTAQRIACNGEIDGASVPQLQSAVATLEPGDVVVDLSRATFMDSTGLAVLLASVSHIVSGGWRAAVVCPPGPVYDLIRMTDLVGPLYVVADEPAAWRMLTR